MFQKRKVALSVLMACLIMVSSGCSVFMAIKQPDYKDTNVLNKGTSRSKVVAELGAPVLTEEKEGKKKDVFVFKQGYGKGNKAARAFFHATADVFSFGLWEVIGTPAEAIASGKNMKVEVIYDKDDNVEQANILSDQKTEPKKEPKGESQEQKEIKENKEPQKNFGP